MTTPALQEAIAKINKAFGTNAIQSLDDDYRADVDVISTGSLKLDLALGIGGLPRGRIIEIYGPESSGKTSICLQTIAEAQKLGGTCAIIDAEHALDIEYAKRLGVQTENLLLSQPTTAEEALEICMTLCQSAEVSVIVVDSVAALVPRVELEGEAGKSAVGVQARLMSQAMRKLAGVSKQTNTLLIFVNQIRMKIGVMFGSPEVTSGGNALKYFSSVRLDIRRGKRITEGSDDTSEALGNETKVRVVKNKLGPPYRVAEFDLIYGVGVDKAKEIIELSCDFGIVQKNGAWFKYNDQKFQGLTNFKEWLMSDEAPKSLDSIEHSIREMTVGV